jgi:4a-hydroxytetrahydrobiopterin dehydratase
MRAGTQQSLLLWDMADLLTDEELSQELAATDWRQDGGSIVLDTDHSDFQSAWAFATAVADAAEAANHHPDILVHSWNKVRVTLSTHSAGGVTELDIALARAVDGFRA